MPLKNATGGALNFHAVSVSPDWADTMDRTTQIGNHIFYRGAPHTRDLGPSKTTSKIQSDIQVRRAVRNRA